LADGGLAIWNVPRIQAELTRIGLAWRADAQPLQEQEPQPFVPATPFERERQARQFLSMGERLASIGRLAEAFPYLAKAYAANPKDTILALEVAALQAWFGQEKELAVTRQRLLAFAKDTTDSGTCDHVAKACSIRQSTDKAELEAALALGRKAVELGKGGQWWDWNLLALGMAEYRCGNYAAAIEALLAAEKAGPNNATATGIAAFYRAMSLFREGKPDEARQLATAAVAQMKPLPKDEQSPLANSANPWDDLILWMAYKEAKAMIKFDAAPKDAEAHFRLGKALADKGQLDEAIASYRKAIELNPKRAGTHYNLGIALAVKDRLDEAIASYQKAIALDAKFAEAHCNLGGVLNRQSRFAESLAAYQRGHELGAKRPGWPYPSAEWVRKAEWVAAIEGKLPAFLKGEFQPRGTAELVGLVGVCEAKKLYHAATRLYADAFAADPKLADDLKAAHRYNAACHAALAAADQGEDAGKLDDKEKARLRKQALDWLRADLALYTMQLESGQLADRTKMQQKLKHWQQESDLAGLRDAAALAQLPAAEQKAFAQFWADVAGLLKTAGQKAN
jgi:tetratricopeptide (TPR) repeat protein